MSNTKRGFTLMEIIIASMLAGVVILGIGSIDVTRVRMEEEIRRRSAWASPSQLEAALAALHITKHLEHADRLNLVGPNSVQIRMPIDTNFDVATNYVWEQYRRNGSNELQFYSDTGAGCGNVRRLARDITLLTFQYEDRAPSPPGNAPLPLDQDNNVLSYALTWDDGTRSQVFSGEITIRAGAYTDVSTGLSSPELGDINPPPAGC